MLESVLPMFSSQACFNYFWSFVFPYKLKILHNEGNYKQGEKTDFRMGENNSKLSNWQRINHKNIQATPAAQFQKNKWPNQKMGQRTK